MSHFKPLILAVFALSGCTTVTNPQNGIRTTEYGAGVQGGGVFVGGDGVIGGCQTALWGTLLPGLVYTYTGESCTVELTVP